MIAAPSAVLLDGWRDPEAVFREGPAQHPHAFWLDAGPASATGWSWLGIGVPEDDPSRVRAVRCARESGDAAFGAFRGGWVGWLGYEGERRVPARP
ncbi:hypothetical protein ABC304_13105 [Microbacterium sp. 1P10UB]|uniref:hypothetical protein n=1 Tax=Microbacterium sp. 1P10UB TaxID=3132287 RepID=UPI00399FE3B3